MQVWHTGTVPRRLSRRAAIAKRIARTTNQANLYPSYVTANYAYTAEENWNCCGGPQWPSLPSDLTDAEWTIVEPMIPPARHGGRKRSVNVREVLNGIFYILWTECQWKALPKVTQTTDERNDLCRVRLGCSHLTNSIYLHMLQRTLQAGFIAPCLPTKTDKLPSGSLRLRPRASRPEPPGSSS